MVYSFDLRFIGFVVGFAVLATHVLALVHANEVRGWLKAFPRSKPAGIALLAVASAWSFWLVATMDLGEFSSYRTMLMIAVPAAFVICLMYVDEFLPVRALGMLFLLMAEPVLESAFLRPEASRLLLVVLAYAWTVAGMFWVGMPFLMRDQITWLLKSNTRWLAACVAGVAYGAAIIVSAAFFYHGV